MKTIFIILVAVLLIGSCNQPDNVRLRRIEKEINTQALGMDIGYQTGRLDTVLVLRKTEAVKGISETLEQDLSVEMDKAIDIYTKVYQDAKAENEASTYHFWKYFVERMQRLKSAEPEDIDYSVYRYTYTIKNQLNPQGERMEVKNYYFFDHLDSLTGYVSDDKVKDYQYRFVQSKNQPFDMLMLQLATGIPD